MIRLSFVLAVLTLGVGAMRCRGRDETVHIPVLLELFTSEGCSSCPPADRLLQVLDEKQPIPGADLIVLSEHVDYWDRLGWKDRFSSSQFTSRQQEYTNRYGLDGVYTPQLVVDGQFGLVGSNGREVLSAIRRAIQEPKIPITIANFSHDNNLVSAHIQLNGSPNLVAGRGVFFVVLADNHDESHVASGENGGNVLTHVAVVRIMKQAGTFDLDKGFSKDITLSLPSGAASNESRFIAFVQDLKSGHVPGVTEQKF